MSPSQIILPVWTPSRLRWDVAKFTKLPKEGTVASPSSWHPDRTPLPKMDVLMRMLQLVQYERLLPNRSNRSLGKIGKKARSSMNGSIFMFQACNASFGLDDGACSCQNKSRLLRSPWFLMSDRIHVTDFQMSKSIYFDIPKIRFLHGPISMRYRTAASVLIAKSWKPWQGRSKGCAHLPAIKNLKR